MVLFPSALMAVKLSLRLISTGFSLHPTNGFFPQVFRFSHSSHGLFGTGSLCSIHTECKLYAVQTNNYSSNCKINAASTDSMYTMQSHFKDKSLDDISNTYEPLNQV